MKNTIADIILRALSIFIGWWLYTNIENEEGHVLAFALIFCVGILTILRKEAADSNYFDIALNLLFGIIGACVILLIYLLISP